MKLRNKPIEFEGVQLLASEKSVREVEGLITGKKLPRTLDSYNDMPWQDYVNMILQAGGRLMQSHGIEIFVRLGSWVLKDSAGELTCATDDFVQAAYYIGDAVPDKDVVPQLIDSDGDGIPDYRDPKYR